jgi:hypothetical protein
MECFRDLEGRPQYGLTAGILAKEREETLRTMRRHKARRSQDIMRSVLRVTGERLHFIVEHSRPRSSSLEEWWRQIHASDTDDRNQEQGTISDSRPRYSSRQEWWRQLHASDTDDRNQEQGTISGNDIGHRGVISSFPACDP